MDLWMGTDGYVHYSLPLGVRIMLAAIIFLFMCLIVCCFAPIWSEIQRRRRLLVLTLGQGPAVSSVQRRRLDPEVLRSLPVSVYRQEDFKDDLECAVCLSELVDGEKARILPKCNHGFHVECIDMWFHSHSTCPICRNPVASESFESNHSPGVRGHVSDNSSQSSDSEGSDAMSELKSESLKFPTNSSNNNHRRSGMLVIDIPREMMNPSSLPSTSRCAEDELKSPM